jgi:hypothetical protein
MYKFECDPTVGSKVTNLFSCYYGLARTDLLFIDWQFHGYSKWGSDPTVGLKVTAIFSRYSGLARTDLFTELLQRNWHPKTLEEI